MARFARIVVRDYPHHITARGNRRESIAIFWQSRPAKPA